MRPQSNIGKVVFGNVEFTGRCLGTPVYVTLEIVTVNQLIRHKVALDL